MSDILENIKNKRDKINEIKTFEDYLNYLDKNKYLFIKKMIMMSIFTSKTYFIH